MLETESLMLRPFRPEDASDLYAYLSCPAVYRYEPGEPVSPREAERIALQRSKTSDYWAAELKAEIRVVGHVSLMKIDPPERLTWELGFIFNPAYQRKGYATEATRAMVAYGFRQLSAHRIIAHCNPANIASWRVLEKTGLTKEGHFRKDVYFRKHSDGRPKWSDTYEYAVLESDQWV